MANHRRPRVRPRTIDRAALFASGLFVGLAFGISGGGYIAAAHADPGDTESDPSWSCVLDGNHVCGPRNDMGAVPGFYVDGVLSQPWPTVSVCATPPTVVGLMLGTTGCHDEYADPAIVIATGWPHQ